MMFDWLCNKKIYFENPSTNDKVRAKNVIQFTNIQNKKIFKNSKIKVASKKIKREL